MGADRAHDIVVFGATGFTGELTAKYLAANAPEGLRWPLAGRNQAKLEGVRAGWAGPGRTLPLLHADVTDQGSLTEVAAGTRVDHHHRRPVQRSTASRWWQACAEAGTAYLDLTGEPEFVDLMYPAAPRAARRETGARLVHYRRV